MISHRPRLVACVAFALALLPCAVAGAQTSPGTTPIGQTDPSVAPPQQFAGLTTNGYITLFRSDSPSNLQGAAPVSGLQSGETLVGISSLPSTGRVYALGSSNRVYVVNPITGVATALSNTPFSPPLNGTTFAFSVDPSTLQARSLSATQDLRISVSTGQVAGVDALYTYAPGDPGAGTTPVLAAIGYSTPPAGSGATSSQYMIDTARHTLVTAATGQALIRTIGDLGVEAADQAGLVVTANGTTYASLRPGTGSNPRLYTVNLSTGAATPVSTDADRATIAYRTSSGDSTSAPIISLAALGDAPADDNRPRVLLSSPNSIRASTLTKSGMSFTVSCNEACSVSGQLTVGKHKITAVTGSVLATAGYVKLRVRLDSAAKKLLKADPTKPFGLKATGTDGAGNRVTVSRSGSTTG